MTSSRDRGHWPRTFGLVGLIAVWAIVTDGDYRLPIAASMAMTWIAWSFSGRNPASFRGMTVFFFAVLYPFSAVLNAVLPVPAMHAQLWEVGTLGLFGYSLGMAGLTAAFVIAQVVGSGRVQFGAREITAITLDDLALTGSQWQYGASALITIGYLVAFAGAFYGGYFYHEYTNFEAANRWFFLGYAKYVSFALTALILQQYIEMRTRLSLILVAASIGQLFVLFGLGGSRAAIVFPLVFLVAFGISIQRGVAIRFGRRAKSSGVKRFIVGSGLAVGAMLINAVWGQFQAAALNSFSLSDRLAALPVAIQGVFSGEGPNSRWDQMLSETGIIGHVAYRVEEFGWAGNAIAYFESQDRAGFSGFSKIPEFVLPSFLRASPYWESGDIVNTSVAINSGLTTGAPPLTTIGDLYRRFGYQGIVGGMTVIGLSLALADAYFRKALLTRRLHFLLFWIHLSTTHITLGIQEFVVQSIRPFAITWAMAMALGYLLSLTDRSRSKVNRTPMRRNLAAYAPAITRESGSMRSPSDRLAPSKSSS